MKKNLLILLALMPVLAFSCKPEKDDPKPEPAEEEVLDVKTTAVSADKGDGTLVIDLQANYSFNVTISNDAQEWLYVISTKAVSAHTVTIGYRANPKAKERSGVVTIKGTSHSATVKVTQAAADPTIEVGLESRTVNPRGMTITVPVTGNDDVVVTPSQDWIKVKEKTSDGYVLEIALNGTGAAREGTVVFSASSDPNVKGTLTLSQKAANVDPATLSILAVANSCVEDAMQDLYPVLTSLGYTNLKLGYFYIDGNLDEQAEAISAENAEVKYFRTDSEAGGAWKSSDTLVVDVLSPDTWDCVVLGQSIADAGAAATYDAGIGKIVATVRKVCEYVPFAWSMAWPYQASSTAAGFAAYGYSQEDMYDAIVSAVKNQVENKEDFEWVIPVGTAVQNLRTSFFEDNVTRSGANLSYNIGRLAAALAWARTISGKDIDRVDYTYKPDTYKYESYYVPAIKEAVKSAVSSPFKVTESVAYPPLKTKIKDEAAAKRMISEAGFTPSDYVEVPVTIIRNAYYNSTSSSNLFAGFNGTASTDENLSKFAATKIFPKAQLPVGTLIVVMEGYQYLPDAWTALSAKTAAASRPGEATGVVEIDDTWWGAFNFRGFNIGKVDAPSLGDDEQEALAGVFGIFIPKTVLGVGGLENYGEGQWKW